MTQFGQLSLWIALLMAAWCATLATQGALLRRTALVRSAARGLCVSLAFTSFSAVALAAAFMDGDYSLRYVATHSGENVEALYKFCAFWSGTPGALLLGSLMACAVGSTAALGAMRRDADRARAAWTVAFVGLAVGATLTVTAFNANPFALLPRVAADGRGLDPIFRNPAMMIQPPLLLLGMACAFVPLALLAAGSIRRGFGGTLLARVRQWSVAAWGLLSAAFVLGAHWSYVSPGLRARTERTPAVVGAAAAWLTMLVVLVALEMRGRAHVARTAGESARRRGGAVLAACGALLCVVTFCARPLTRDYNAQIDDGAKYSATDAWGHRWTFTSQGESRLERLGDDVTQLALLPTRDGVRQPFVSSESRAYYGPQGLDIYPAQTIPAVRSTVAQDLYVVLSDVTEGHAVLRISFRPLVELAWAGGVLFALGGVLFFWPARTEYAT